MFVFLLPLVSLICVYITFSTSGVTNPRHLADLVLLAENQRVNMRWMNMNNSIMGEDLDLVSVLTTGRE